MTSAAMLGLALSMGASGVLLADGEASAAIDLQSASMPSNSPSDVQPAAPSEAQAPAVVLNNSQASTKSASRYHTVEEGDSLWHIASSHQVSVQDIKVANGITPETPLQVGQVIKVPSQANPLAEVRTAPTTLVAVTPEDASTASALESTSPSTFEVNPTIVSVVEPSQSDALRSAGLTSNSDGFRQDLERMQAAELEAQTLSASAPQVQTAPIPVVSTLAPTLNNNYRVQAGDTLATIAASFGLSADELIQANGISDPNLIFAGANLVIPENQFAGVTPRQPQVPVVLSAASSTSVPAISAPTGTRLSHLQATAERRVESSTLLQRLKPTEVASAPVEVRPSVSTTTGQGGVDPYAADLIEQVEVARSQSSVQPTEAVPVAEADIQLFSSAPAQPVEIANTELAVNLEFRNRVEAAEAPTAVLTAARPVQSAPAATPDLLAAAPLSPDVYQPSSPSQAGQMVSPEMPLLPASDEYLPDAPGRFNGYIWPTTGVLTSGYGRRWGRMHRGVDVAGPVGTPIMAAAPGVVERAGWNSGGYGYLVEVRHPDGSMTRYAHNSRILVRAGQEVDQGQQISEMGSTGYSTGPHLHFEIHIPNQGTVNPVAYLPNR
jgi:murein DD-endopeptidase MepM/ murein hydrolase activator NlpD